MRNKKSFLLALLACCALAWPGISLASQAPDQQTIAVSKSDWMTLQENNRKQQTALETSAKALKQAQTALETSQTALSEAQNTLKTSRENTKALQTALSESQQETIALKNELKQQKEQIGTLQLRLTELRQQSSNAENSIAAAQKSLDDTRAEWLKSEKAHERTENRLKNRIKAWQIVAAIVGGVALTR